MTRDVAGDRVGRQVPDRQSLAHPAAQHRRGDPDLAACRRTGPARRSAQLAQRPLDRRPLGARPLRHRQRGQRQHPLGLAPLRQPRGDVRADDQVQLTVWCSESAAPQGYRPCNDVSLAPDLEIGHREALLVALERQPAQLQPVLGAGLVLDRLVRRYPCGNQHHSIEIAAEGTPPGRRRGDQDVAD